MTQHLEVCGLREPYEKYAREKIMENVKNYGKL